MKLYIWKAVPYVTDRYHSEGGVAVVAADRGAAEAMVMAHCERFVSEYEEYRAGNVADVEGSLSADPDILDLAGSSTPLPDPPLWIFPDAGCC